MTQRSKRELWREVERLKESQQNRSPTNLFRENTDADNNINSDEEAYEKLAERLDELF